MTTTDRYLLGRAGRTPVSIRTPAILRVWRTDTNAPNLPYDPEPIDLRVLLGGVPSAPGVAIALETGEMTGVVIVDAVSGMATIPEAEFFTLPQVFGFARKFFDAACRRAIEDAHPLRLRSQLRTD